MALMRDQIVDLKKQVVGLEKLLEMSNNEISFLKETIGIKNDLHEELIENLKDEAKRELALLNASVSSSKREVEAMEERSEAQSRVFSRFQEASFFGRLRFVFNGL